MKLHLRRHISTQEKSTWGAPMAWIRRVPQGSQQVLHSVRLDVVESLHQDSQPAPRKALLPKPDDVGLGEVEE